jgi:hypothetical protein
MNKEVIKTVASSTSCRVIMNHRTLKNFMTSVSEPLLLFREESFVIRACNERALQMCCLEKDKEGAAVESNNSSSRKLLEEIYYILYLRFVRGKSFKVLDNWIRDCLGYAKRQQQQPVPWMILHSDISFKKEQQQQQQHQQEHQSQKLCDRYICESLTQELGYLLYEKSMRYSEEEKNDKQKRKKKKKLHKKQLISKFRGLEDDEEIEKALRAGSILIQKRRGEDTFHSATTILDTTKCIEIMNEEQLQEEKPSEFSKRHFLNHQSSQKKKEEAAAAAAGTSGEDTEEKEDDEQDSWHNGGNTTTRKRRKTTREFESEFINNDSQEKENTLFSFEHIYTRQEQGQQQQQHQNFPESPEEYFKNIRKQSMEGTGTFKGFVIYQGPNLLFPSQQKEQERLQQPSKRGKDHHSEKEEEEEEEEEEDKKGKFWQGGNKRSEERKNDMALPSSEFEVEMTRQEMKEKVIRCSEEDESLTNRVTTFNLSGIEIELSEKEETLQERHVQLKQSEFELELMEQKMKERGLRNVERDQELDSREKAYNSSSNELDVEEEKLQQRKERLKQSQVELEVSEHKVKERAIRCAAQDQEFEDREKAYILSSKELDVEEEKLQQIKEQLKQSQVELEVSEHKVKERAIRCAAQDQEFEDREKAYILSSKELDKKEQILCERKEQVRQLEVSIAILEQNLQERATACSEKDQELEEENKKKIYNLSSLELQAKEEELQERSEQLKQTQLELEALQQKLKERTTKCAEDDQRLENREKAYIFSCKELSEKEQKLQESNEALEKQKANLNEEQKNFEKSELAFKERKDQVDKEEIELQNIKKRQKKTRKAYAKEDKKFDEIADQLKAKYAENQIKEREVEQFAYCLAQRRKEIELNEKELSLKKQFKELIWYIPSSEDRYKHSLTDQTSIISSTGQQGKGFTFLSSKEVLTSYNFFTLQTVINRAYFPSTLDHIQSGISNRQHYFLSYLEFNKFYGHSRDPNFIEGWIEAAAGDNTSLTEQVAANLCKCNHLEKVVPPSSSPPPQNENKYPRILILCQHQIPREWRTFDRSDYYTKPAHILCFLVMGTSELFRPRRK